MYKWFTVDLDAYIISAWGTEPTSAWTESEVQRTTGAAEKPFGTQSAGF
jgi:hypothetical protein